MPIPAFGEKLKNSIHKKCTSSNNFLLALSILLLTLFGTPSASVAQDSLGHSLPKVSLQLIWKHQGQFVGYYVAKEKGFYREAGLDVDIREFDFDMDVTQDVLTGKADFGIGRSSLVLEKMEGRDVYLLSAMFQHSPLMLLALKRDDLKTISDLKDKRIMVADNMVGMAALTSMLLSNRVTPDHYTEQDHTFNVDDLITGKTDAVAAYISNEPFQMEKRGIEYTMFKPADYGIDFYSDILFTSKQLHDANPEMMSRFNKASLRGWQYAFENIEEAVAIIFEKYNTQNRDRDALRFEVKTLKTLAYSGGAPLGHIDGGRIDEIARTYRLLGFTKQTLQKEGFFAKGQASSTLTPEEMSWIEKRKTPVIVGAEMDWPPFDFVKNGKVTGYSNELLSLAAKKVGLPIKYVSGVTWAELLKQFEAGSVEVLPAIYKTPEREKVYAFTDMYAVNPSVLVAHRANESIQGVGDLSGKTIATIAGFSTAQLINSRYPDIQHIEMKDVYAGLKSVSLGKADAFIGSLAVISHILKTYVLPDIRIVDEVSFMSLDETTLHMAVLKKNQILLDILQKGLDEVTEEEQNALRRKWLTPPITTEKDLRINFTEEEQAWIEANPEIKVSALADWPPFEFSNDAGEQEGISIDVTRLVASRVGLTPVFVSEKWTVIIEQLKSGELDVAPSVARNKERESFMEFTEPYIFLKDAVFTRHSFEKKIKNADELEGMTVAVEQGYYQHSHLSEQYPKIKLHVVPSTLEALQAVSRGQADAYIGILEVGAYMVNRYLLSDLKVAAYLDDGGNDIHMAVPLDKKILRDILQKGLDTLTKKDIREIKARYITVDASISEPEIILTPKEKQWLRKHRAVTLGVDQYFFPFDFMTENGAHGGVSSEYIDYLARQLKVQFTLAKGLSWQEVLEKAKNSQIDVIPCLMATPERKEYLLFTKPYITSSIVIFTQKSSPLMSGLDNLAGKRVAVIKDYYTHEILARNHPDLNLAAFGSADEALQALSAGRVDAYVDEIVSAGYAIEKLGINNVKVAATSEYSLELAMGVRKDWPELVGILNKGLDSITPEMAAEFKSRWAGLTFELKTDIKTILAWALPIGGGLVLIIILIVAANRRLGREVADRKAAETKVRAMSEASLDAVIMINSRGEVLFWNQAAEKMFGYVAEEAMGKEMHTLFVPEEYRAQAFAGLEQFARTGTGDALGKVLELYALNGEGKRFPVEVAVSPFQLDDGWYAVGSVRDITLRKKAEEALREAEERSRLVLESAAEGIFGVDDKGGLLFINTSACDMLGICDTDTTGKNVHKLIHHSHEDGSHYPEEECPMYWSFSRGETHTINDEVLWRADGASFPVEYSSSPIFKDENVVGAVITFRDITERKLIEEQIRAARAELLLIFDNSQVGIMFMHKDCELARVNQSMADLIGWESPREMIGVNMRDLHLSEESFQEFKQANHAVLLRGEQCRIEYQLKKRDGAPVWCALSGKAVDTASPRDLQKGVIWVVEDITVRKQMEEELRKSEAHFRTILTTAEEGFWQIDTNGLTVDVNDAMCRILGRSMEEVLGKNIFSFLDAENKAILQRQLERRHHGEKSSYELAVTRPDGSQIPTIRHASPIYNDDGEPVGSFSMVTDISEIKAAEQELRVKEKRLRSYFSNSLVGVAITSPDKGWIEVNERFLQMLGYSFEELQPLTWSDLSHPEDIYADLEHYDRMLAGEIESYTMDKRYLCKHGGLLYANIAVSCIRGDAGDVKMIMGSYIDISERVEAQRERDEAFEIITSSINYATNIQGAILPSAESMNATLADHFVLWEPRDKVGGDIYFMKKWGLGKLIALGDCTGHGVPGAFMTLIVNGALEMGLLEVPPGEVGVLLQRVHQLLQKSLDQDHDKGASDDGIEMGVCYLAPRNKKMTFGGARFSLFRVQDGKAEEIKGDKKGMGYRAIPQDMTYSKQEVSLDHGADEGATFYMTTDGLIDQVGGPKRRSFGKKRFKQLLLDMEDAPMGERGTRLLAALEEYQGDEKRRDDVAVVGFRL